MPRSSRKLRMGANVMVVSICAVALWAMLNYVNARHFRRLDMTEEKTFSLSDRTRSVLKSVEKDVHITTLFRPDTLLFLQVRDILEEYSYQSPRITVEHVDAERDNAKVQLLAKRLNTDSFELNSAVFECGEKTKHVTESELLEQDMQSMYNPYQPPPPPKFKGEEAFTSAILSVTQEKQTRLYFVSGHGEKDTEGYDERAGLSTMAKTLKRENLSLEKLSLLGTEKIPDDCDVLVIAGPEKPYSQAELEVLGAYLGGGGKLFVMADPLSESGLEGLLSSWGVKLSDTIVLDPVRRIFFAGPTTIFVEDYPRHAITSKMGGLATVFSLAGMVEPSGGQRFDSVSIARTSADAWAETKIHDQKAKFDEGEDTKGPVSIGVAVSEMEQQPGMPPQPVPQGEKSGFRLVVFGDSDFVSNALVDNPGNGDLFLNCINWLAKKEKLISIAAKKPDVRIASITAPQAKTVFWLIVIALPVCGIIAGLTVWRRRRS